MLTEVLAELDEVEAEARLDELAETGPRGAEVARLYAAYRFGARELLTGPQIARVAAAAVRAGTAPETTVVLFAPHRLSPAERDLLTALAGEGRLRCVVATTSDAGIEAEDQALIRWAEELLGPASTAGGRADEKVTLSWAPDAEEEVARGGAHHPRLPRRAIRFVPSASQSPTAPRRRTRGCWTSSSPSRGCLST